MMCWCGYLSGARCRFAYGPADAIATPKPHRLLPHLNPDWFYLSGTGLPRLSFSCLRFTISLQVVPLGLFFGGGGIRVEGVKYIAEVNTDV